MEAFIKITAHFIDSDWKLRSCFLQTKSTDNKHSAKNLANHIFSVVTEEYGLQRENICDVVHDNARNVTKMNEILLEEMACETWLMSYVPLIPYNLLFR